MPGFNINNFRNNGLIFGGARPSYFVVTLEFPNTVPFLPANLARKKLQFTCQAATLPPSIIGKVEVPYFGRRISFAGDRVFPDWDIRVMNDEDFLVRDAFEAWHNAINTLVSNRMDPNVASPIPTIGNSYKTIATVTQFAKTGPGETDSEGAIKTYRFDGTFPLQVGPISLDWDEQNRIEIFDVTLAYDWWEPQVFGDDKPLFPTSLNPE